jgi:arginyl-tRNA synthetase
MAEGKTREQADKLDLKDDVLCRSNAIYTNIAADIAYTATSWKSGALTRRSTSGGQTTTAMWPVSRPPWTAWAWTAPTG